MLGTWPNAAGGKAGVGFQLQIELTSNEMCIPFMTCRDLAKLGDHFDDDDAQKGSVK